MSTSRTDEVETANKFPGSTEYYAMVVHARALERELTALTAERDHWQEIAKTASAEREHNANVAQAMTAERDQLRAAIDAGMKEDAK
jgi:hypothetical protein